MKKCNFILSLLLIVVSLQAQDYQLTFGGTGASSTIDSVKILNLKQGKSITISGTESLHLVGILTGISSGLISYDEALRIYPNPTAGDITVEFSATAPGKTKIELFDISGKKISSIQHLLPVGRHSFDVSGLSTGTYPVKISSHGYSYTGILVSNNTSGAQLNISFNEKSDNSGSTAKLKTSNNEKEMQYNTGDRLLITGISGNFRTILTDIPTQSKTIVFTFVPCTDADGNNYPVVKIGSRLWTAENLKTTKYQNGEPIQLITDVSKWNTVNSGAYYNYFNDDNTAKIHGRLYNFYSINDERKIAPYGWHVATSAEWATLISYLGGGSKAGGKLKESGTANWKSPNNYATNETGFTAIPGGFQMGGYYLLDGVADWWTSTAYNGSYAWHQFLYNDRSDIYGENNVWGIGLSVRSVLNEKEDFPTLTTDSVYAVTGTTAMSDITIKSAGRAAIISRGVCWSTSPNPTIENDKTVEGTGIGSFKSSITGLLPGMIYYFRAYATNSIGTSYGNELTAITPIIKPILFTKIYGNTATTAMSGGIINNYGGSPILARGVCWSLTQTPTTSDSKTIENSEGESFISSITGLIADTTYYLRAYATNAAGTGYGNELILKTYAGTVTDIDGNIYNTVKIGNQLWLAENLKTTKNNDGTEIELVTDNTQWAELKTPGYCWYNNDIKYKDTFGALYNLRAAVNSKICPIGWHVPNPNEYPALIEYLGSWDYAGMKMRSSTGWMIYNEPDTNVYNSSGFTGQPGGYREYDGSFYGMSYFGSFWTYDSPYMFIWVYELYSGGTIERSIYSDQFGYSVRCISN